MNLDEFQKFMEERKHALKTKSTVEKISTLVTWCRQRHIEELILRLSSEGKGGWSKNALLNFTTKRLIVTKKSFGKKFFDVGYVAGLSAFPMALVSEKAMKKINEGKYIDVPFESLLNQENYYIPYTAMKEFVLRKGIESTIANMFGRMIVSNYIRIVTSKQTYEYTLPVNKNGTVEQIYPWLSILLPIKVSIS